MTNPPEIAVARFRQDFNCAQSVLVAFAPQLGMDESQALKLASPFGGGVVRRGQICGAVTGALMVLGLAQGRRIPTGWDRNSCSVLSPSTQPSFAGNCWTAISARLKAFSRRARRARSLPSARYSCVTRLKSSRKCSLNVDVRMPHPSCPLHQGCEAYPNRKRKD
jgi:C_GCAxxG_C_C family probable redox protein